MEITPVPEIVTVDQIIALRHAVLRPNRPVETAQFAEDHDEGVFHVALREDAAPRDGSLRDDSGRVVCCATFVPKALEGEPAWQLRGMATATDRQGQGLGGRVLEAGVELVRARGGALLWCNGRKTATPFYLRHGFSIHGEEFEIPLVGPHYVLIRRL